MQKIKFILPIILIFILTPTAQSVGVAPASQELNTNNEIQKTLTLYAINTKQEQVEVEVYIEGDLEKYIHTPTPKLTLQPDEIKPN